MEPRHQDDDVPHLFDEEGNSLLSGLLAGFGVTLGILSIPASFVAFTSASIFPLGMTVLLFVLSIVFRRVYRFFLAGACVAGALISFFMFLPSTSLIVSDVVTFPSVGVVIIALLTISVFLAIRE